MTTQTPTKMKNFASIPEKEHNIWSCKLVKYYSTSISIQRRPTQIENTSINLSTEERSLIQCLKMCQGL